MSAEQKLDRFKQSILNELSRQEEEMHVRMEQERKSAFEQAENEILAQCIHTLRARPRGSRRKHTAAGPRERLR